MTGSAPAGAVDVTVDVTVDVVVPVHGAAAPLDRCLRSLARAGPGAHRLVVVVDGPQDPDVEAVLARATPETGPRTVVLRNRTRRGFVGAANRGLSHSRRDVVLLNSDTEVVPGWIESLARAAASAPEIATVTPFSNHATICSLPRPLVENELPLGYDVERFAALVARVAERSYPRIPTGVGVCLYVKRAVLEQVGPLDEERFGLGYGEENDLCMRARQAGWVHALDDAGFVYHLGQGSFGRDRAARVRRASRTMRRLHPAYEPLIADFLRTDPLRGARERVLAALAAEATRPTESGPEATGATRRAGPRRVLHVVHGWPPHARGGTERYAHGLVARQAEHRVVAVYTRRSHPGRPHRHVIEREEDGVRVRAVVNDFRQRDPLSRNALLDLPLGRDLGRLLDELRPELVHVHHLAGHAAALVPLVARRGIPVLLQLQDWWSVCARSNLFDPRHGLCPGPATGRCAGCFPLTAVPPAALTNRVAHALRSWWLRRCVGAASGTVLGSRFAARSLEELGLGEPGAGGGRRWVLPYGIEPPATVAAPRAAPASPLRLGYVGSVLPHKGVHVAAEAVAALPEGRAVLHVWGDPGIDPAYAERLRRLAGGARLVLEGAFPEADKDAVYDAMDVLVAPSLGLESFGLAPREARARGVPVLAARRGALTETLDPDDPGVERFDPERPSDLAALVERVAAGAALAGPGARSPRPVLAMDEHADAIEAVYAELLARRGETRP